MPHTKKPLVRNSKLLRRIARQIENHPEEYNQDSWFGTTDKTACGTTACIAGWAVTLDRYNSVTGLKEAKTWWEHNYHKLDLLDLGAKALGLTEYERKLFSGIWHPKRGLTVPEALRAFADGAPLYEVSLYGDPFDAEYYPEPVHSTTTRPRRRASTN